MPTKAGRGGQAPRTRNHSVDNGPNRKTVAPIVSTPQDNRLATRANQPKFAIAPLILEGTKLNKLQLNDLIKQHMSDIRLTDIQLGRTGTFTLYPYDVKSFNLLLNDLPAVLTTNNQPTAKLFVPRSIQRVQDTEKVAFVKRVDIEVPEDRITAALINLGLKVTNVTRLIGKDGNTPTRTVKVMFADAENRNTFVHTGLQVDSMHFTAEPATQNTKPVQCYVCMQYKHVAKYCKTNQQVCARCGESHRLDQCTAPKDTSKCCNCSGNHLATSVDCSKYKEQEKKAQNMVNQYTTARQSNAWAPAIHSNTEFPPLHNPTQLQQQNTTEDFLEGIIASLSSKMEKIVEDIANRIILTLQQKIERLEKSVFPSQSITSTQPTTSNLPTTSNPRTTTKPPTTASATATTLTPTTTSTPTLTYTPTTTNDKTKTDKQTSNVKLKTAATNKKQTPSTNTAKRPIEEANSSLDTSIGEHKDRKISNNDD